MKKLTKIIVATTMASISVEVSALAAENSQKLSGSQIRARFAGMQLTDDVHWRSPSCFAGKSATLLIAATAVVGLIAFPLLQPTWVMVKF